MSDPFVKLYATLLESSLWWGEDAPTRLVWITLLVAADHTGLYQGTLPGLAGKARVTLEEARNAVWRLQQTDSESRTPDHGGKRIEVVPGIGYRLLNYGKYRDKRSPKQVQDAAYKAAQRERSRNSDSPDMSTESGEVSKISNLRSEDLRSDPDPDARENEGSQPSSRLSREDASPLSVTGPSRALMPHEAAEARKASRGLPEAPGAQPALRYNFRSDWMPSKAHRARGLELGLSDEEILARAEDCRLKPIKQGFTDEDNHFMRELGWAKRDKDIQKAKEASYANRKDFEVPGHRRHRE